MELGIRDTVDNEEASKFNKPFPTDYKDIIEVVPTRLLCFDHKDLLLKGGADAFDSVSLAFFVSIPKKFCKNSTEDEGMCEPTKEYRDTTQNHRYWNIMNS